MRWLIAVCLIFGFGCHGGGYDQSLMAKLTAKEQGIVGKYLLETSFQGTENNELKSFAEAMQALGGETTIECFPDKSFLMVVSQVVVEGKWVVDGMFVRLSIKSVGGKNPGEIGRAKDRARGISGFDLNNPQRSEFLQDFMNTMALERAESLRNLRIGVDGHSLYSSEGTSNDLFGATVSTFKPIADK